MNQLETASFNTEKNWMSTEVAKERSYSQKITKLKLRLGKLQFD